MFVYPLGSQGGVVLDALVTTAAGAVSATVGVLVGGMVTRRAQDRQWLRDQQLVAYQELSATMPSSRWNSGERTVTGVAGTTTGASGARP